MKGGARFVPGLLHFVAGIAACLLGLTLASSIGHQIATLPRSSRGWFEVDFIDPRALWLAVVLQVLFVSLAFAAVGRWSTTLKRRSTWILLVPANPLATLVGYLAYRLILPLSPEAAYMGPANLVAMTLAFPVFFLMTVFGRRLQPR